MPAGTMDRQESARILWWVAARLLDIEQLRTTNIPILAVPSRTFQSVCQEETEYEYDLANLVRMRSA